MESKVEAGRGDSAHARPTEVIARQERATEGTNRLAELRDAATLTDAQIISLYSALGLKVDSEHRLLQSHLSPVVGWPKHPKPGEGGASLHLYTTHIPQRWPTKEHPSLKLGSGSKLVLRHPGGFLAFVVLRDEDGGERRVELRLCPRLAIRIAERADAVGMSELNPIETQLRLSLVVGEKKASVAVWAGSLPAQEGYVKSTHVDGAVVDLRHDLRHLRDLLASPRYSPDSIERTSQMLKILQDLEPCRPMAVYDFALENRTQWTERAPIVWEDALRGAWCFKAEFQGSKAKVGRAIDVGEDTIEIRPIPTNTRNEEADLQLFTENDRGALWFAILPEAGGVLEGKWIIHLLGYQAGLMAHHSSSVEPMYARIQRVGQSVKQAKCWWAEKKKIEGAFELDMRALCKS